MITFLTLLLGLVVGPQPLEMAAPEGTAWVEMRLDGQPVMLVEGPPFKATVDFGDVLAPRRLEAIAFGDDDTELARAEQFVNLTPTPARVSLVLEGDDDGRPVTARVLWAAGGEAPEAVAVQLDGEPLAVGADGRAALPPRLDLDRPHHLHAEVSFAGTALTAGAVFGGVYGSEAAAKLTAVPLDAPGRRVRRPGQVGDWLRAGGAPARVAAVEHGEADLVLVVDRSAWPELHALGPELLLRAKLAVEPAPNLAPGDASSSDFSRNAAVGLRFDDLREGDRLYFVLAERQAGEVAGSGSGGEAGDRRPADLFRRTSASGLGNGALPYQLAGARLPDRGGPQALADALAVAGRWAAASGRPRAVVLVVGPGAGADDASRIPYAEVRGYLERLRVPLHVWYVADPARPVSPAELRRHGLRWDGPAGEAVEGASPEDGANRGERRRHVETWWGPFDSVVESLDGLVDAGSRLRGSLDRQRVVWVEGAWLPSEIELVEAPRGVAFAGVGGGAED